MRLGFTTRKTLTVTIARPKRPKNAPENWVPEESVDVQLVAFPAGWLTILNQTFQPPELYKNGKPTEVPKADLIRYNGRYNWLMLAKAMEATEDALECGQVDLKQNRNLLANHADAVEAEFVAANFTDGEIEILMRAMLEMIGARDVERIEEAAGN